MFSQVTLMTTAIMSEEQLITIYFTQIWFRLNWLTRFERKMITCKMRATDVC